MMKDKQWIASLQEKVTLVAVSKTKTREQIQSLYARGITIFAENKVQELKQKARPDDPWAWHFIGHLQTNKVKDVLEFSTFIHSVDSIRLLDRIASVALLRQMEVTILVQLKLTDEKTKYGLDPAELPSFLERLKDYPHIHCLGMMAMGPLSEDSSKTYDTFRCAKELFEETKKTHSEWTVLSMGMSDDYLIAIKCGSTMVRLGSILFND